MCDNCCSACVCESRNPVEMSDLEMMRDIFGKQWELNEFTLTKKGWNYRSIVEKQDLYWIENYRKALEAELGELIDEHWDQGEDIATQNGKVEIVDIVHFLVSLSHLTGVGSTDAVDNFNGPWGDDTDFDCLIKHMSSGLFTLLRVTPYKWWSAGQHFDVYSANKAVEYMWRVLGQLAILAGMDMEDIYRIYIQKNEVNFKRQINGYDATKKTEDDNLAIR
jgi:dimeric dUTPase (all-alpha-NTP-PPase superfamily)